MVGFILCLLALLPGCVVVGGKKGSNQEIARANVELAAEYYRLNRLEPALTSLKKALNADARSVDGNSLMALLYSRLDEKDLAQAYFEKAIDYVASDTVKYGEVHNNYAVFLCANGHYADAVTHFLLAVNNKLYNTPEVAYENAGLCALKHQDKNKANRFFADALAIDPNMPRVLLEAARLNLMAKKYQLTQQLLRRYNKNNAATAESLWLLLQAEIGLGNHNAARKTLDQLKSRFPDAIETRNGLKLLVSDRDPASACAMYARALAGSRSDINSG